MHDWYYSPDSGQRQGPVDTATLISLFRSGQLLQQTLVWREGQAQWQPMSDFASELGLASADGSALPPPLPPSRTHVAPSVAGTARRPGLSGCAIALIVLVVCAVPVIAILAAIALPAYNDYVQRATVASALPVAEPLKLAVSTYLARTQACPGNDDSGFEPPENYRGGSVGSATVGEFEGGRCGIELMLAVPGKAQLDGKAIWLELDPQDSSWHCSSEIEDRYLPTQCRQ